jgi:hypothetical protein
MRTIVILAVGLVCIIAAFGSGITALGNADRNELGQP